MLWEGSRSRSSLAFLCAGTCWRASLWSYAFFLSFLSRCFLSLFGQFVSVITFTFPDAFLISFIWNCTCVVLTLALLCCSYPACVRCRFLWLSHIQFLHGINKDPYFVLSHFFYQGLPFMCLAAFHWCNCVFMLESLFSSWSCSGLNLLDMLRWNAVLTSFVLRTLILYLALCLLCCQTSWGVTLCEA